MVKCIKQLPCTLFCCVEIYEWFNIARKFFLSTEHTEDTETILVEDYSKDFVLDLPIGYFCHDSAKNKVLDLFSALAAPKIRASPMRSPLKFFPKARYSSAFWSEILVKDSLLSKEKILDMI